MFYQNDILPFSLAKYATKNRKDKMNSDNPMWLYAYMLELFGICFRLCKILFVSPTDQRVHKQIG